MSSHLPKLSYVLLAHNREKYIRAAIESAFAQDYAGELEYIFCDDCSTDRTYEIIQQCVADYTGHRHIVVTQTPENGHLAVNTNHAVQHVSSDWIIRADDDDLSSVDRCTLIGEAIAAHPDCTYVVTGVKQFTDAEEESILAESQQPSRTAHTCQRVANIRDGYDALRGRDPSTYSYKAWHRCVFDQFGPLHKQGYYVDDLCCYNRANLLGYGVYVEHANNVFMRMGSENMSRGGDDNSRGYHAIMRLERFNDKYYNITFEPMELDITAYRAYLQQQSPEERAACEPFLRSLDGDMDTRAELRHYWRKGILNRLRIRKKFRYKGLFSYLRSLPMPLFACCLACVRRVKD